MGGSIRRWAGLMAFAALWVPAHAAAAANSPTFRDCAHVFGLDPDFVKLSGATVGSDGTLTVSSSQAAVTLEASESTIPGDNLNHVSFSVTVTGTAISARTVSGTGVGHVTLTVPLSGVAVGGHYSLDWSATFDNRTHQCPGSTDPQNPTSNPFVLDVVAGGASTPAITRLRESSRTLLPRKGIRFTFDLDQPAGVRFLFRERSHGHLITRGALTRAGSAGPNTLRFSGQIPHAGHLAPGRYLLVLTATSAAGRRSAPASIAFAVRPRSARRA
jgi:hypothetical protein